MTNYGCGYCKYRDTIVNWCTKHNKQVRFDCKANFTTCDDYEYDDDLPIFFCAIDLQDLTNKIPTLCPDYKSIGDDDISCATCEYFRDNMTPDTIITLE